MFDFEANQLVTLHQCHMNMKYLSVANLNEIKLWTLDEIQKAVRCELFVNGPYCWLWEGVKWLRFKIKLGVFSDKILFKCITSTPGWLLAAGWWLGGNKSRVFSAAARRSGAEMETEWRDNLHHRDTGLRRVTTRVAALWIYANQTAVPYDYCCIKEKALCRSLLCDSEIFANLRLKL